MIAWNTKQVPKWKQILYQIRILKAQFGYFDHLGFDCGYLGIPYPSRKRGYQSKIAKLRNSHLKKPCTIVCNGPSLSGIPPELFQKTVTIGCNGIYKKFKDWGFATDFLVFEDVEQFEIRAPELRAVTGPTKLAAIYNAYALSHSRDWIFFNSPRCASNSYYWSPDDTYPQFSEDFASIVHLGGTVTYIMLQLAFHLGCDPVYILGLDHNYGPLPDLFPPGKILITKENLEIVQKCHFDPNYYKIGDVIGVPWVKKQEQAFRTASMVFNARMRSLYNVSDTTKLTEIPIMSISEWRRLSAMST